MDRSASTPQPNVSPWYDLPMDLWEPAHPEKWLRNPGDEAYPWSDPNATLATLDIVNGKWRPAKVRLFTPQNNDPYKSRHHLLITYHNSPYPTEAIAIHQLYQSDIRPTHFSVFNSDRTEPVIGIHRRTGKTYDAPPDASNFDASASSSLLSHSQSSSGGLQISSPRPIVHGHPRSAGWDVGSSVAAAERSREVSSYPPIYIKFHSKDDYNTWISLLHAYAKPDSYVDGVAKDPAHNDEVFQHRIWRGVSLTLDWLDGLDGNEEGSALSKATKDQGATAHHTDYDFYFDIILDGLFVGRTTAQHWIPSHSTNSPMRVDWNEHFDFPDLPSLGRLHLLAWRMKSERTDYKEKGREAGGLTSSLSAGVAFLSNAVGLGHKERSRTCIGELQISLKDFRRGDLVEGKWAVTSFASKIPWRMGNPITTGLKLKVEEYSIMPLEAYTPLSTFLKPASTFHLLGMHSFPGSPKTKGSEALIKTCFPTLHQCFYELSVDDNTIGQDAVYLLTEEISSLAENTSEHRGTSSGHTLFRSGAATTKLIQTMMTNLGRDWLLQTLEPFVKDVQESVGKKDKDKGEHKGKGSSKQLQLETGAGINVPAATEAEELQAWCAKACWALYTSRVHCPDTLRLIFNAIRTEVEDKFGSKFQRAQSYKTKPRKDYSTSATAEDSPEHDQGQDQSEGGDKDDKSDLFKYRAISSFTFLRLFSPALLHPHLYHLSKGRPDDASCAILKDVARALQQLANLNLSRGKAADPVLRSLFSKERLAQMLDYLRHISTLDPPTVPSTSASTPTPGRNSPRIPQVASATFALQARLQVLPAIHRESVLLSPHRIDAARCLATIAAAVARHVRDDDLADSIAYNDWSKLRRICLQIEEQRLRCSRILEPKSPEGERDEPSWQMAQTSKTVSRTWDEDDRPVEEDVKPGPVQNRRMGGVFSSPLLDNQHQQPSPALSQQSTFTTPRIGATEPIQGPSPALSQISTFTNATIGYGNLLNDYYFEGEGDTAPEPLSPPSVASGSGSGAPPPRPPRLGRRPSTAPSKVSQIPGLSTTSENDPSGNVS